MAENIYPLINWGYCTSFFSDRDLNGPWTLCCEINISTVSRQVSRASSLLPDTISTSKMRSLQLDFCHGNPQNYIFFPPSLQRILRIFYDFGLNFWTHLAYAKSILASSSSCKPFEKPPPSNMSSCRSWSQSKVRSDVLEHKRWSNHLWVGYSLEVILDELWCFFQRVLQCHIIKLQDD